jgi:hypothetical protein
MMGTLFSGKEFIWGFSCRHTSGSRTALASPLPHAHLCLKSPLPAPRTLPLFSPRLLGAFFSVGLGANRLVRNSGVRGQVGIPSHPDAAFVNNFISPGLPFQTVYEITGMSHTP